MAFSRSSPPLDLRALNETLPGDDNTSMATDTTAPGAISARLRATFALQAVSELELDYDGANPPSGLLAELAALGWEGATACPPPASAIDWSRPDPVKGTRHTIRSFPATTTAVLHGTEAHRSVILAATRAVLTSYGIALEADPRPSGAAGPPRGPGAAAAGREQAVAHRAAPGGGTLGTSVRPPAGSGPGPALAGPKGQRPGRRVELVVASAHAGEAVRRLADVGILIDDQADLWTTSITYRGTVQETVHPARHLTVELGVEGVDVALVLAGLTVWSMR